MADEKEKQGAEHAGGEAAKSRRKFPKTLVIVALVAVVEGGLFFAASKLFGGGPQVSYGASSGKNVIEGAEPAEPSTAEVALLENFRVPNDRSGRLFIYDFDMTLKVPGHRSEEIVEFVAKHHGEISDRVARVVRASDSAVLHEPELKTLRVQVQQVVSEIVRDQDVILEVLIPRFVPIQAG